MPTAQETFAKMMKEEIAPALRRFGFKGSGQRYEFPSETSWAIIGFQKSTWSDRNEVSFTVNVTLVGRDEWAKARAERPYLGERPSANANDGVGLEDRLGFLMPDNLDRWWTVRADDPTEPVAGEVVAAIKEFVLPRFRGSA